MKYLSMNELDHFQFHDAEIEKMILIDNQMTWEVSDVNAITSNTQNDFPKDMCIKNAVMEFEDVCIISLVYSAYDVYGPEKKLIKSVEAIPAKPDEYNDILRQSSDNYCYMQGMESLLKIGDEKYQACFLIDNVDDMYYLTFTFSKSTISWDEYSGEAWYEHPKWHKK